MRTLSSVIASLLIAASSTAVMAQMQDNQPYGEPRDTGSAFSVIDRNGDDVIDHDEAAAAGISDSQFKQMDTNGDDSVTESEYQNFVNQSRHK